MSTGERSNPARCCGALLFVCPPILKNPSPRGQRTQSGHPGVVFAFEPQRKACDKTRAAVARKLNIGQDTVSRYERQTDLLLSTLRRYVEAVDGKLSLVVEFPDRKSIKIRGFRELSEKPRQRA